jgi:hypothetical protein
LAQYRKIYLGVLGVLIFSAIGNFSLWNDGAHFLFRLLEHGLFLDPLWGRKLDYSFQLIPSLILLLSDDLSLVTFSFKVSVLLTPILIMMLRSIFLIKVGEKKAVSFLNSFLFWIVPIVLFFPVSTIYLSVSIGAILLSLFLQKKKYLGDSLVLFILMILISLGHELAYVLLVMPLLILYVTKNTSTNDSPWNYKTIVAMTVIGFTIILAYRIPFWTGKLAYISSSRVGGVADYVGMIIWLGFIPWGIVSEKLALKRLSGLLFIIGLVCIGMSHYKDFYSWVTIYRFLVVALLLNLFYIAYKFDINESKFIKLGSILYLVMLFKVSIFWRGSDRSFHIYSATPGCKVVSENDFKSFTPPYWTFPYLSVILQESYQLTSILFHDLDRAGDCVRSGKTVLFSPSKMNTYIDFHGKFKADTLLDNIPVLEWSTDKDFPLNEYQIKSSDSFHIISKKSNECVSFKGRVYGSDGLYLEIIKNEKLVQKILLQEQFNEKWQLPEGTSEVLLNTEKLGTLYIEKMTVGKCL